MIKQVIQGATGANYYIGRTDISICIQPGRQRMRLVGGRLLKVGED